MQLHDYLRDEKVTDHEFGARVGASPYAVGKWRRGERVPRPQAMRRIAEVTGGKVTAADFYARPGSAPAADPPPVASPASAPVHGAETAGGPA